ncbi:putative ABC peptide transporter, periplasmic binding protein [Nonlabens dokdonensis DSW-6]|uniref:Putative ABC peptide transporter, periplasmic binding protein n=1 Tax=Nonlabens dokdonensis (strain DSM 17205 / KCTC 12402 / DSW-6) TaxID=592029 RepID=L7WB63_NONDD|nr:putative ABC peptide transporter, periplasmic binding protein [Nonlabens dokdonensis DSW-6]
MVIITSCNESDQEIDPTTVFRYNEHANVTSLDPAFAKDQRNIWVCNLLYNGLVKLDQNLDVVPDLTSHWEVDSTATIYKFYLKKDVYFNDAFAKARTVTAQDFKYSLERLIDPKVASPGASVLQNVEEIKALGELELEITLKQPFPAFLGLLSMKYCSVVPDGSTNLREHPIGTGPFYLKRWQENVKMVLRKNERYFEKDKNGAQLPYLEAVAITFKTDKQSEFLEFAQGNLDFINAIDPSYKDELLTTSGTLKLKYLEDVHLIKSPFLNTEYLGIKIDNDVPELQSKNLRKAINYGFDRNKMIKYLRNNIGTPAQHGFIPDGLPAGGVVKGYSYNPELAQKLIDSYKKETGDFQPSITISTGANYLDLCEFIQKEMQKIGLEVKIDVMTPSALRQARKDGQLDIFRSSWIADYPDAENYLALFYSKNFSPAGPNYTHFKNSLYDSLYERSLRSTNPEKRKNLYIKMDSLIIEEAPIVPLYYDQSVRFISKDVKNLESNAVNMLDLTRVRKEK